MGDPILDIITKPNPCHTTHTPCLYTSISNHAFISLCIQILNKKTSHSTWSAMKLHLVFIICVLLATGVFGLSTAATHINRKHSIATSPALGASSSSPAMSSFFPSPSLGSYPALPPAPAQGPSSGGSLGMHSASGGSSVASCGSLELLVVMTVLLAIL